MPFAIQITVKHGGHLSVRQYQRKEISFLGSVSTKTTYLYKLLLPSRRQEEEAAMMDKTSTNICGETGTKVSHRLDLYAEEAVFAKGVINNFCNLDTGRNEKILSAYDRCNP